MCSAFFHLNFLSVQGILAQKIEDPHATFCQFSDVKNRNNPNSQASLVSWFMVSPSALELAVQRKDNLIFQ